MHSLVVVGTLQVFAVALTLALCTKQDDFVPGSSCAISKAVKVVQQLPSNYAEEDLECAFVKDKSSFLADGGGEPEWAYEPWTECSASCGGGNMTTKRHCARPSDGAELPPEACGGGQTALRMSCNTHKCASWTGWGPWPCPVYCGELRTNTRRRTCQDTQSGDMLDEHHCTLLGGLAYESQGSCGGLYSCPTWSEWSFGACSSTCEIGSRPDTRTCIEEKGEVTTGCVGDPSRLAQCGSEWSDWNLGTCSPSCNTGSRTDTRQCLNIWGQASNSGCCGADSRVEQCGAAWSNWYTGTCSSSCSSGSRTDYRNCINFQGQQISTSNCCGFSTQGGACGVTYTGGPYGWNGGSDYDDCPTYTSHGRITGIQLKFGAFIDGIRVRYGSTWSTWRGNSGAGTHDRLIERSNPLDPLRINKITIKYGEYVDSIQFHSDYHLVDYGTYGGGGGSSTSYPSVSSDCELRHISGKHGGYLDRIIFHFTCDYP